MGNNSSNLTPECLEGAWFCDCLKFEIRHTSAERGVVVCSEQRSMLRNEWTFKYEMPIKNIGKGLSFAGYVLKKSDIPTKRGPNNAIIWTHWYNKSAVRWTRRYVRQAQFAQDCQELHRHLAENSLQDFYDSLRGYAGKIDQLGSISDAQLSENFSEEQIRHWRRIYPEQSNDLWAQEDLVLCELPSIHLDNEFDVRCGQLLMKLNELSLQKKAGLCGENTCLKAFMAYYPEATMDDVQEFFTLPNGDQDLQTLRNLVNILRQEIKADSMPSPTCLRSCAASSLRGDFDPEYVLNDIWGEEEAEDALLADLWMSANLLRPGNALPVSPLCTPRSPIISGLNLTKHTML